SDGASRECGDVIRRFRHSARRYGFRRRYSMRPALHIAALTAIRVVSLGALLFAVSEIALGQQTIKVTEFPAPNGPVEIATGPEGALWFTEEEEGGNRMGRMTTAGVTTEYSLPSGHIPRDITAGPDGALWFTESGFIGRITTAGVITE